MTCKYNDCKGLTSVTIPKSVTNIGSNAFGYCSGLTSITVASDNPIYDSRNNCNAIVETKSSILIAGCKNSIIPNYITIIGDWAFYGCSGLTSITIPNSVIDIRDHAFYCCSGLTSITIPNSVTSIGNNAFSGCTLRTVKSKIRNPFKIETNVFENYLPTDTELTVPYGTKNRYEVTEGWNVFSKITEEVLTIYSLDYTDVASGALPEGWRITDGSEVRDYPSQNSVGPRTFVGFTGYQGKALYWRNTSAEYGRLSDYPLTLAPGNYRLTFAMAAWKESPTYQVNILSSSGSNVKSSETLTAKPNVDGNGYGDVSSAVHNTLDFEIKTKGNYVIQFLDNSNGFDEFLLLECELDRTTSASHSLSITSIGNGYVAYDGNTIRSKTSSFSVEEGTNAILKFSSDEGNRLKSVKANGLDVTSAVVGNQYTVNNITANTSIEVVFETIPTYTLSIVATGNGSALYNGTTIRNKSQSFTLREGASSVVSFSADSGYRIKTVKVNNTDVSSQINNGQITINSITKDTNVEVVFEEIPQTTYSMSITASGSGSITYNGDTVKGKTSSFTVAEGSYVTVQLFADDGYRLKGITLNGQDVTENVVNNQ